MTLTRMLWSSTGRQIVASGRVPAGRVPAMIRQTRSYSEKDHRDHQSVESNPGPQQKNYEDAKSYNKEQDNSLSEGVRRRSIAFQEDTTEYMVFAALGQSIITS